VLLSVQRTKTDVLFVTALILVVDGNIERVLTIDHTKLLDVLDKVEQIYSMGISKVVIADNLLLANKIKGHNLTLMELIQYERIIVPYRLTDEFTLALFIAQKEA
jgi:hypothetical protein